MLTREAIASVTLRMTGAVVALVLLGNGAILGMSWWAQRTAPPSTADSLRGVKNLEAVDSRLWRGAAPSAEGYRNLARSGITTVVDLRAEHGAGAAAGAVQASGMRYVHLPVRDGQVPDSAQVSEFLRIVEGAPGPVFVHCGAGVGRTGAMAGAYLVASGERPGAALRRNLAVGPPSLEQVAFVAGVEDGGALAPVHAGVTALSRLMDFPRRAWHVLGF